MPPNPSGSRPQFAGDDRTQLLPTVDPATRLFAPLGDLERRDYFDQDFAAYKRDIIRHGLRDQPTEVIPVTPAQPEADWDKPELPDCKKKATAMGVLFGAGVVAGAVIGVPVGMVLLFVILMAKVVM